MAEIPAILKDPDKEPTPQQRMNRTVQSIEGAPGDTAPPSPAPEGGPEAPAPAGEDSDVPDILGTPEEAPTSFGEQASAFGRSALGAGTRFSGVIPGMMMGAKLSAGPAAATGPFAPLIVAGGVLLGGGLGYFAGDTAAEELERQGLAITDPYELPPNQRAAGVAGEAFGAGVSALSPTMAIAQTPSRLPPSAVGKVMNGVLDLARDKPVQFLASELTALSSASAAEGLYEHVRPGRPLERTAVGVAAGVLNPTRVMLGASHKAYQIGRNVWQRLSPSGKQTRAGALLKEFLGQEGGDPDAIMRALSETDQIAKSIPGFKGTAAQTTGDTRLAQLEAELGELEREFFGTASEKATESLRAISNAIALLRGTGDPAAFRGVAELRQVRYRAALDRLLTHARLRAVQAAEEVTDGGTLADRANLSRQVTDLYQRSLERARAVEADLWREAIPDADNTAAVWRSVRRVHSNLKGELAAAGTLPEFITKELDAVAEASAIVRMSRQGATELPDGTRITAQMLRQAQRRTSVGELLRFRTELLARARGLARSTNELADTQARQFGLMAEAVLDDLVRAGVATKTTAREGIRRGAGGRLGADTTPFDEARMFSKQLNDTFTRSFVGAAQQQGAYGMRVPPETLLKRAFASGDEMASLQLRELQEAVDFLPVRQFGNPAALGEVNADVATMLDAQSRLLRIMAGQAVTEVVDPQTGQRSARVSLARMKRFMEKAGDVLDRFPEIRRSLEEATSSEAKFQEWTRRARGLQRTIERDSAIARVLQVESPADAVRGALNSPRPLERMQEMATLAKASPEAQAGLRAAVFDHVIRRATTPDQKLSLQRLVDGIEEPMRPGLPSLRQFMEQNGLFPAEAGRRLDELIDAAARVMTAVEARAVGEQVLDPTHPIEALLVRGAGSEVARRALRVIQPEGGGAGGPTLIVAYQGAKAAQEFATRLPNRAVQKLITDAVSGAPITPDAQPFSLLRTLMEKGGDAGRVIARYAQLHAYAWQAGLLGAEDEAVGVPGGEEDDFRPEGLPAILGDAEAAEFQNAAPIPPETPERPEAPEMGPRTFEDIAAAVMHVESGGRKDAVSPKGAVGRMQTMPDTLRDPGFGVKPAADPTDPAERLRVGREYLQAMLEKYDGNLDRALAAYNWGPGNVDRWVAKGARKDKLPKETRDYIKKVKKRLREQSPG